ncbi:DUF2065 domain-containing protein [Catenovulum agarivorans]|uniref:DUF2065 domain-containing protein n=1 Tax=Catenovulum agarivorans TaxID=1172192 RepID=UPI0002DF640B|nr:DUF2065 domain-containing protein [Catenovulum agarivorans]
MEFAWLKLIALVLIIEGIGPFLFPNKWRNYLIQMAQMPAQQMRIIGGFLLLIGTIILWLN